MFQLGSADITIPLILGAMLVFAIAYDKALDYPMIVGCTVLLIALAAFGTFDPQSWGHTRDALAVAPPAGEVRLCGAGRGSPGLPCHLEAPPFRVLMAGLAMFAAATASAFYWRVRQPFVRIACGLCLGLLAPWLLVRQFPGVHVTWFYNPLVVVPAAVVPVLAALVPAYLDRLRRSIADEVDDLAVPRRQSASASLREAASATAGMAGDVVAAIRTAIRNIRRKGWAALTGAAAMVLVAQLTPATATSPLFLMLFPAAFMAGLALWIVVEALLVEPGAWD